MLPLAAPDLGRVETLDLCPLKTARAFLVSRQKRGCYALIARISGTTPKICIARFKL